MLPFVDPCLPTRVTVAPRGPMWVHEIKHDGYRLMVRRTPAGVRIRTRRGYDWTERFPRIVEAAEQAARHVVRDRRRGRDARPDGVSDFDRLHSRRHDGEVQLLGFDLLELDGTDLRGEPLIHRKATLASLLRRSRDGIQLVEHIEAADGATVFEHACKLGLEGHRVEAARLALSARPLAHVAQGEEPGEPGDAARVGGSMVKPQLRAPSSRSRSDGVVRSHRDFRETAIEAARFLQQRNPGAKIAITDLRDGSVVPHGRSDLRRVPPCRNRADPQDVRPCLPAQHAGMSLNPHVISTTGLTRVALRTPQTIDVDQPSRRKIGDNATFWAWATRPDRAYGGQ